MKTGATIGLTLMMLGAGCCTLTVGEADGGAGGGSSGAGASSAGTSGAGSSSGSSSGGASSGGVGSTGGQPDAGLPFDQLLSQEVAAYCEVTARCSPSASYIQAVCAQQGTTNARGSFDLLAADIDAGLVVYDPLQAQVCVSAIANASCADYAGAIFAEACLSSLLPIYGSSWSGAAGDCLSALYFAPNTNALPSAHLPAGCSSMLTGQVGAGGSCNQNAECGPGTSGVCSATSPECQGTCEAYAEAGQPCYGGATPFPGPLCDPGQPLSCGPAPVTDAGLPLTDAGTELWVCIEPPAQGDPCLYDQGLENVACRSGLLCDYDSGTCEPPPPPGTAGEACDPEAAPTTCAPGLYCSGMTAGVCLAQVGDGGECSPGLNNACVAGLVCAGSSLIFDAATGAYVAVTGHCSPPLDVNGSCSAPPLGDTVEYAVTGCLDGLACDQGSCVIPPSSGAISDDPNIACNPLTSFQSNTTCSPQLAVGSSCDADFQCSSGYCENQCVAPPSCFSAN